MVGSGPAGLMAADVVSQAGISVTVFEKRKSAGRKLLVAGSSGLNITNGLPVERFIQHYTGPQELWKRVIESYPPAAWIRFIEELGYKTFEGTSGRYFIEEMKASRFLQTWMKKLLGQGVQFRFGEECSGFSVDPFKKTCELKTHAGESAEFHAICFALGGGSWEPQEVPLRWPSIFKDLDLGFEDFTPSNVGYRVSWPEKFLEEAEGLPLKGIVLTSGRGSRPGDAMITEYGIEGTPIYFCGETGEVRIDLKPDLSEAGVLRKLEEVKENLSPIRRVKKLLGLGPAALALIYHLTPPVILQGNLIDLAKRIKSFPLDLLGPQPLSEAISSAGGLSLSELDQDFMIRRFPGVFAVGEMLDWDVPTGGFLIQACVAQGMAAGNGIMRYLDS